MKSWFEKIVMPCVVLVAVTACGTAGGNTESAPAVPSEAPAMPQDVRLLGGDRVDLAASRELHTSAPYAVVAPADDVAATTRAASIAVATSTPLLLSGARLDPAATATELDRLGATAVLTVGALAPTDPAFRGRAVVAAPGEIARLSELTGKKLQDRALDDQAALVSTIAQLTPSDGAVLSVTNRTPKTSGTKATTTTRPTPAPTTPANPSGSGAPGGSAKPSGGANAPGAAHAPGPGHAPGAASPPGAANASGTPNPPGAANSSGAANAPGVTPTVLPAVDGPKRTGVVVFAHQPAGAGVADVVAGAATARAAGAKVLALAVPDPRVDGTSVGAIKDRATSAVFALGGGFGTPEVFNARVAAAKSVPELPGGGQLLFPGRRMIAAYGTPNEPAMGVLGEQDPQATAVRITKLAEQYKNSSKEKVIPAIEIIVTIAGAAGPDNDYSYDAPIEDVKRYVDAATAAGAYAVLDLQPGRTDFLTQAKAFEELLRRPNVGLALDAEWRLLPHEEHLKQIGHVQVSEVNAVIDWLAKLTDAHKLPQKLLILHQFQQQMIRNRAQLDTTKESVAVLVHADGHGTPGDKLGTWNGLRQGLPEGVWLGWKNFYDEDTPMYTPEKTMQVSPAPWFVSYQ